MGAESRPERRRLFFAPNPEDDGADAPAVTRLPRALDRRLAYANAQIPWNIQDPVRRKRPGRAFLESAGLVREYRTDRLLEVVSELLSGDVSAAVQLGALEFAYALFPSLNRAQRTALGGIRLRVPNQDGTWMMASDLVYSAAWGMPNASLLDRLIRSAGDRAQTIADLKTRLIAPPSAWPCRIDDTLRWSEFLRALGVQDGLPLERRAVRPAPRYGSDLRPEVLASEIGLPPTLAEQWIADVNRAWAHGNHPYTAYALTGPLVCLPAASEVGELSCEERRLYARLVAAGLSLWPDDVFAVTVARPNRPITARDPHLWPTPASSFLRNASWLPIESAGEDPDGCRFVRPDEAWARFEADMPSFAPALLRPIRRLLEEPTARIRLEGAGLHVWDDPGSSGHLVRYLGEMLMAQGIPDHLSVSYKHQYRQAWAALVQQPDRWPWADAEPVLAAMEGSRLRSLRPAHGTTMYVPDDVEPAKRALLELGNRPVLVIGPDEGADVASLLAEHGIAATPTSLVSLEVYGDDMIIVPGPDLPRLVEGERSWLAVVIGLVVALKSGQFARRGEKGMRSAMERLQRIRLARPSRVRLVIDGQVVEPGEGTGSLPIHDDSYPTVVVWRDGGVWSELEAAAGSIAQILQQPSLADALRATLMALGRDVGDEQPGRLDDAALARALQVMEDEVREHRQDLRGPMVGVLERLRAIVAYWLGPETLPAFDDATRVASDNHQVASVLDDLSPNLPLPSDELIALCEDSPSLADLRDRLGLDFRRFNEALAALDPPHPPLQHSERHEEAFTRFLVSRRASIIDRLRERYLQDALSGGDLSDYGAARNLADLAPDAAWLEEYATPPEGAMEARMRGWLAERGADTDLERQTDLLPIEEVRKANLAEILRIVARADAVTRTWCHRAGVVRSPSWDSAPASRVRSALETSFAGDFIELTDERMLAIIALTLGWPAGMPVTIDLDALALTEGGLLSREDVDDAERQRRIRERTQLEVDGRDVPVGREHIPVLVEAASASVDEDFLMQDGRSPLQEMPTRAPSRGGSQPRSHYTFSSRPTLSDDQREAVGLFGEVAAKAWLERHYADVEWVSGIRNLVMGDDVGSDSLGYDFQARHGPQDPLLRGEGSGRGRCRTSRVPAGRDRDPGWTGALPDRRVPHPAGHRCARQVDPTHPRAAQPAVTQGRRTLHPPRPGPEVSVHHRLPVVRGPSTMSGASGARPDFRGHRTWGRIVRSAVILAVGVGSVAAYAAVSATVNAQPATPQFNGWVAVLQPAGAPSGDQVELMVLAGMPSAPGSHPKLGYMVAVCGDHPFEGVLVVGGDAQLRDIQVIAGATSQSLSVDDVQDLTLVQAGRVGLGPAQILHLSFADIPPCTGPVATAPPYPAFTGAAEMESGLAMAPVRSDSSVLWWTGPRSSQHWPLIGTFPGFPAGDAGVFTGGAGLSGEWVRPIPEYVRVEAGGLAARASLDEAQPQPASTTGLDWEDVRPLQPTARVTDVDAMSRWQQALVAAGIGLGIGASLLAAWFFELGRPMQSHESAASVGRSPQTTRPGGPEGAEAVRSIPVLLLVAALILLASRRRR